jgi:hypothetical protein
VFASGDVGSVDTTRSVEVSVAGIYAAGYVGEVLVWGSIIPDQDPNWSPIQPDPSAMWSSIQPDPPAGWAPIQPDPLSVWSDTAPSQSPDWVQIAA